MLPPKLPSDVRQSRLLKALRKTGFIIDLSHGKGSHAQAIDPKSGKYITVPNHLYKIALYEILKLAEDLGYNANEIMSNY
ncbi:MAG: type II toxin-antitoxin system HicA family toxin [Patescibacteria group bacterium]